MKRFADSTGRIEIRMTPNQEPARPSADAWLRLARVAWLTVASYGAISLLLAALAMNHPWYLLGLRKANAPPPFEAPFLLVFSSGGLGSALASWAVFRSLRSRDKTNARLLALQSQSLIGDTVVGGILACVLMSAFASGLVGGVLFPAFEKGADGIKNISGWGRMMHLIPLDEVNAAKAIFWSVSAGVSGGFVVDIFRTFARKAMERVRGGEGDSPS